MLGCRVKTYFARCHPKGNPELATLVQVLATLGFRLAFAPIERVPACACLKVGRRAYHEQHLMRRLADQIHTSALSCQPPSTALWASPRPRRDTAEIAVEAPSHGG